MYINNYNVFVIYYTLTLFLEQYSWQTKHKSGENLFIAPASNSSDRLFIVVLIFLILFLGSFSKEKNLKNEISINI